MALLPSLYPGPPQAAGAREGAGHYQLPAVRLHTSGPMTVLPNEWHKTMPDPLLVCRVSGQVLRQETFFVNEPPEQKWQHRPEHDEPPVRAKRKRRAKKVQ